MKNVDQSRIDELEQSLTVIDVLAGIVRNLLESGDAKKIEPAISIVDAILRETFKSRLP